MLTVAILGASADRSKFGNKSVRAHRQAGYTVYPINPKGGTIEGLMAFRTLAEAPAGRLDRVSVYLQPDVAFWALDEVAKRGCGELWLNPGSDDPKVVEKAQQLGLNVIQACSIVNLGMSPAEFAD